MKFFLKSSGVSLVLFAGLFLFTKNADSQQSVNRAEPVKIGLLVTDSNSVAAINAATLAIKAANNSGGFNGHPFKLIVRQLSGPWGTGSKQAVNLVFDEKVWALIGSHDGRNGHLIEQAATKSRVVFISVWAGDPTLSQAFVPWFFNGIPNDNQQASALVDGIFKGSGHFNTAVISDDSYDSGQSLKSFLYKVTSTGKPVPLQLKWEECGSDPGIVADKLVQSGINAIVIFCRPKTANNIVSIIGQRKIGLTLFGSLSLLNEDELTMKELQVYNGKLIVPYGSLNISKLKTFADLYSKTFGKEPGTVAVSSFDGMNILIEAIKKAGSSDREKIQNSLKNISYEGISGTIGFDERGNRNDTIRLANVKEGMPSVTYH